MGSPMTPEGRERSDLPTPNDRKMDNIFSPPPLTSHKRGDTSVMFSADGDFNSSPDFSPSRPIQAPNDPSNEVEALPQYERELTNVRAKLKANESELEAVQLRLTDVEKGLAKSKAEADTLRAQTATGSVNRDEDQVTCMLMECMQAIEAEVVSKWWNEKSIEDMECCNEGWKRRLVRGAHKHPPKCRSHASPSSPFQSCDDFPCHITSQMSPPCPSNDGGNGDVPVFGLKANIDRHCKWPKAMSNRNEGAWTSL
jgi:hypothetical protein